MIVSLNWLKEYVDIKLSPAEVADKIGRLLVEVESTTKLAERYRGAVIVRVVEAIDHPNSDHLHICKLDDAGVVQDVPRNDDGTVQVVCGAPNVHSGMLACWLPPRTTVPDSYGTDDEFVLSARKLRGVLSQGMMASPSELALWDESDGILDLSDTAATPGTTLIDLLDLDDTLFEVENKSLTHRPDCFGVIGFAREVAAILGQQATIPAWFNQLEATIPAENGVTPTVTIMDQEACPHYECVVLDQINSKAVLPLKLRSRLERNGVRSSTALVDLTNLIMLETGQPLHAFDYDKLLAISPTGKPNIVVRLANAGEKLTLLDERTIQLSNKDIVVCVGDASHSVPVALAGAMGGKATAVDQTTKRVLLESATFNLYNLRNTQFRHGIFSEAITRFTKGQPIALCRPALARAVTLLKQYAGAQVISAPVCAGHSRPKERRIEFALDKVSNVLGLFKGEKYDADLVERTLANLQYKDVAVTDQVAVTIPWWRPDVNIDEDVIEDIGRVNGYDNIALDLPMRYCTAAKVEELHNIRRVLLQRLREQGGNEVYRYSFIPRDLLVKTHDRPDLAYRITNALSPELQYYRRSLLPTLLESVRDNYRAHYDGFMLFEAGKVHHKGQMDPAELSLPAELTEVSAVLLQETDQCSAFYTAKQILNYALGNIATQYVRFDQVKDSIDTSNDIFEPQRSAVVYSGKQIIAVVGELKQDVLQYFKLPDRVAALRIFTDKISLSQLTAHCYTPVMRYQGTSRDITYQVSNTVTCDEILSYLKNNLKQMPESIVVSVQVSDIFAPNDQQRNITVHMDFYDKNKTIDPKEVARIMQLISNNAAQIEAKVI